MRAAHQARPLINECIPCDVEAYDRCFDAFRGDIILELLAAFMKWPTPISLLAAEAEKAPSLDQRDHKFYGCAMQQVCMAMDGVQLVWEWENLNQQGPKTNVQSALGARGSSHSTLYIYNIQPTYNLYK